MAIKNQFYITTTIPYANAPPHIGFALEIIQADVLARWHRLQGEEVFFLTGTDEHGSKNYKMAKEAGLTPQEFVDKNSSYFKELTKSLNISNNNFIRTTDKKAHWPGVIEIWNILSKNGDIYKRRYGGHYCNGCERFVTEKDLVNGKCADHPNLNIEKIFEENYFFRLSKYSSKIIELIKKDKLKIYPKKWKNDFLALIKDGLTDVSFSREKKHLPWGIPVPGDKNQVLYVWPDALTNYLTGIGYPNKKYQKFWPADLHVVGKDMLRFHTGIWPGMLLSAGLPLPKKVIVHGFLTFNGQKISKSLGNVISPNSLVEMCGVDAVRYFVCRNFVFGDDGDFSQKALVERHNNELSNKLGNLVSRVSALAETYRLEKSETINSKQLLKKVEKCFESYELDKALNEIFAFIDYLNEDIQQSKPWETKDKKVLYRLVNGIKDAAILLSPFIPQTSEKISKIFNFDISLKSLSTPIKITKIKKSAHLFNKIEFAEKPVVLSSKSNVENKPKEDKELNLMTTDKIPYADFERLDLRVGKILQVEDHPKADKLYVLKVDLAEAQPRTIVAGLRPFYKKEALLHKKAIFVANLASANLRGIESNGMILAASTPDHKKVIILTIDSDIEIGSKVG